jgi:hypothetical protein
MKYQDCIAPAQALAETAAGGARRCDANINPRTGLATDYLNHFNEAIMLLELLPACPDCLEEFLRWRPMNYREHFAGSRFEGRELAISAYEDANPELRKALDSLSSTMTAMLLAARGALRVETRPKPSAVIAARALACLKPLVARAGAAINGEAEEAEPATPQAAVDRLMKQIFS